MALVRIGCIIAIPDICLQRVWVGEDEGQTACQCWLICPGNLEVL